MGKAELNKTIIALATDLLDKTRLDDFLNFAQFAKDNKFSIRKKSSYSWNIGTKQVDLFTLNLFGHEKYKPDGTWSIIPRGRYFSRIDKHIKDTKLQTFLLTTVNLNSCGTCKGDTCANFEKIAYHTFLFGKELKGLCSGEPIRIFNPTDDSLEHAKELLLIMRDIIEVKNKN